MIVSLCRTRTGQSLLLGLLSAFFVIISGIGIASVATSTATSIPTYIGQSELLVTDVEGLAGIRQVGPFHAGGAIPSNPEFLIETLEGRILDPERLLVASSSNYGLPLYNDQMLPGSLLSLDVEDGAYAIPPDFAAQAKSVLDGKVMMYSAQSEDYINSHYNSGAVTRHLPNVSNPKYISINNAFGRPWQANSPYGVEGAGHISVSDPDGKPLANPPSLDSGGVFFGELSNRVYGDYKTNTVIRKWLPGNVARDTNHQYIPGDLTSASISTTFMGISPDSSGFAVFSAVGADGSVSQVHVQDGTDGLLEAGVIQPHPDDSTMAGTVFRWIPDLALYITDFYGDRIALLSLDTDKNVFRAKEVTYLTAPDLHQPVDIAAVIPEIANPRFSSNTTLAGTSDLYVANQDGTILRMTQDGTVLAKVKVKTDYANSRKGEIKSLSTSYDAQTIFVGMEGKDNHDFIVKIPAFNAHGFYPDQTSDQATMVSFEKRTPEVDLEPSAEAGQQLFRKEFGPEDGMHHVFSANSCVACHSHPIEGGFSKDDAHFVRRVSQYSKLTGHFNPVESHNFPVAKRSDVSAMGKTPEQSAGIPMEANIVSMRMPLSLLDIGRLDEIPDYVIKANARSQGYGIQGRVNLIDTKDGKKIGRYGWKADQPSLTHMVADALATELGIDNAHTLANEMRANKTASAATTEAANSYMVQSLTRYLQTLDSQTLNTQTLGTQTLDTPNSGEA